MKKILEIAAIMLLVVGACQAVDYSLHMSDARVYRVALGSGTAPSAADMKTIGIRPGDMVINTDDDVLYIMSATNVYTKITSDGTLTTAAFAPTTITASGKTTLNGELEVNGSDVDINMTLSANKLTIDQTNATGVASTPLLKITDARTGSTANEATEASLVITPSGTYAISATAGISALQALECTTLTASSTVSIPDKSIVPADINVASTYIIVGNAGATGAAVAVSGDITMDNVGATTIGSGKVHANMLDATIVTNVLASGMVLPAVDYSAATNGAAGNIASGNLALAQMTNGLATAGPYVLGNIPGASLTNACGVGAALISVTNKSDIGAGYTNVITFFGTVSGTLAP